MIILLSAWIGVASAAPRRVLIVHSFGSAAPPFTTHSIAFETELTEKLGERVDLDEISLDMARYAHPEMQEALVDYIRKRQAQWQPDLVVPIGSPACVFVAQYRDLLFPKTPVLYTGSDQRRLPAGALTNNAAFVGENFNLPDMVEDMLQVAPATTNIAVVIGASPLEQFWAAAFRKEFEPFTNRVSFTWLNNLSFDEMLGRVSKLPPHSYILFILLLQDAAGVTHNGDEALKHMHAVANAPMNSIFQHQLGLGIVGGRLYQAELEGVESARIAIRILHGEPASAFPPRIVGPLPPEYDWRELQRWGISEARLPAGSTIQFRQPGFWGLYRWWIVGTVAFILLQTVLIVGLFVNRAKRRQGEAEAALIADISTKFVNLSAGEVDREITDAQRRICRLIGVEMSTLWQWTSEAPEALILTHFYRFLAGPPTPERMSAGEYFPWCQRELRADRIVVLSSLEDLPAEVDRDRETFRYFNVKSALIIPLSVGGGPPVGALSFNSVRAERNWPDALVKRLQLVAQIFTNVLARKRADQALRESEERLSLASVTAGFGVWMWNVARNQVWASEHWLRLFGFAPGETITFEKLLQRIHPDDRQRVERVVRRAVADGARYMEEYRVRLPDGAEHWISTHGRMHPSENGRPARLLGASIDITGRKRAELELAQQRSELTHLSRVTTMGELSSSLAHELNQPLAIILTNAQAAQRLLAQQPPDVAEAREILADIVSEDQRAGEVIQRLRTFLKPGQVRLLPLSMNDLVEDVLRIARSDLIGRGLTVHTALAGNLPQSLGDRIQLQQVLLNLILNAGDAMAANPPARRQLTLATAHREQMVEISVSDTGCGLPPDKARIFEPFYTTKQHGLGLGLAICRSIIAVHHGRLWAESGVPAGSGATFHVELPVAARGSIQSSVIGKH